MSNQDRRPNDLGDNLREGVRTVAGILGALKDAVEESFDELRQRGDLSPERAREAARSTVQRAQQEMEGVRDRLDFVSRKELDALRAEVDALRVRLDAHPQAQHPPSGSASRAQGPADTQATDAAPERHSSTGGGATGGAPGGFPIDGG